MLPPSHNMEPSFARITGELRSRVLKGIWKSGQMIGSEKELAAEFKVCHSTIKKSLKELEREGLLWARRGKGRFVASPAARQKTWTLGGVIFNLNQLTHPVLSRRIAGIQEVIGRTDYHFQLFGINMAAAARLEGRRTNLWMGLVDPRAIDAMIIIAQQVEDEPVVALAREVPVVWIDHPTVHANLVGVRLDYLGGAFAAAQHLLDLGHRRIAQILVREPYSVGREQRDGIRLALRDRGQTVTLTAEGNAVDEGRRLGKALADLPDRPTAVICGSDELALGACQALHEAGITIPQDLSLIAWNDTLTTQEVPVPLTTIRMNFRQSGVRAAERLLWMLDHPNQPCEPDQIPAELIVRQSTARRGPGHE